MSTTPAAVVETNVWLYGLPNIGLSIRTMPRRDLDPRGPIPVPGRKNVQDYLGIHDVRADGISEAGMWLLDNREHQYWHGNDGSFEPRHSDVATQAIRGDGAEFHVVLSYDCQDVVTTQAWVFAPGSDDASPTIDCRLTALNRSEFAREGYSQFFANYHPAADGAQYLDGNGRLQDAPNYAFLDVEGTRATAECMGSIDADWIRSPGMERVSGVAPVLVSPPYWGGRWRHLMLFSAEIWGLVTWRSDGALMSFRALDWLIGPPSGALGAGGSFTAHVRHLIVPADVTAEQIHAHRQAWDGGR
jgi:hypothetical protein